METLLQLLVLFGVVLAVASLWFAKPIERVVETESVGKVREILLFGFFVPLENLSHRLNQLERDKEEALRKARKLDKQISDEKKLIKDRETAIQSLYRSHLNEHGGKRRWWYLFRKVPVPSFFFVKEEMDKREERSKQGRVTEFIPEGFELPPGVPAEKVWWFKSKANQAAIDRQENQSRRNKQQQNQQQQGGQ